MKTNYKTALKLLKEGNKKYCETGLNPSGMTKADRKCLIKNGQHPFACVICCSDSRVVPEHIFSVGLGALFTVRTAGNVIGSHELASVEYAVTHLDTPLVIVMGHTHCGAVEAALNGHSDGAVKEITDKILFSLQDSDAAKTKSGQYDIRKCEKINTAQGVKDLMKSPLLREAARTGKIRITAAMYDTESGRVSFLRGF